MVKTAELKMGGGNWSNICSWKSGFWVAVNLFFFLNLLGFIAKRWFFAFHFEIVEANHPTQLANQLSE